MSREVYFVVAVDLDEGKVFIDDNTYVARFFPNEQVWDTETQEWRLKEDGEYELAVKLLYTKKMETD